MIRKLTVFMMLSLCVTNYTFALTQEEETEGRNFDKGENFQECMDNCHDYHKELGWRRGHGKGMCWDECRNAHANKKKTKSRKSKKRRHVKEENE